MLWTHIDDSSGGAIRRVPRISNLVVILREGDAVSRDDLLAETTAALALAHDLLPTLQ